MNKIGLFKVLFIFAAFSLPLISFAQSEILVKGLFKNSAILTINGRQTLLKVGQTSAEGVYLVSADSKAAVVEFEGKRQRLALSRGIGTAYTQPDQKVVRLQSQHNGHFFGSARINGRSVQFLVDTGASSVSMNSITAESIGIRYKKGAVVRVTTANGVVRGFQLNLNSVDVGGIVIEKVPVVILEGEYPTDVLLGNSFLSRVDMRVENGVLVLQTKY